MSAIWQFMVAHQVICTLVIGGVWSALIGALPAPTATSSLFYQFLFKFLNLLAANVSRALSTKLEGSPNWQPAVQQAVKNGSAAKPAGQ